MKYVIRIGMYYILKPTEQFSIVLSKNEKEGYYWAYEINEDAIISEDRMELAEHIRLHYMQVYRGGGVGYPEQYWIDDTKSFTGDIEITPIVEENGVYKVGAYTEVLDYHLNKGFDPVCKWVVQVEANKDIYLVIDQKDPSKIFDDDPVPYLSDDKSKRIIYDNPIAAAMDLEHYEYKYDIKLTFNPEIKLNKMPK